MSITAGVLITQNDPIESTRKLQDEKLQISSAEFIQATVLYYSIHTGLPWFSEEEKGEGCFGNTTQITTIPMKAFKPCLESLVSDNALRKDFVTSTPLDRLFVTNPNPQTDEKLDTIICFQPQSERWQKDSNTKYNINGELASENRCNSQGGSEFCYWCTQ
jgi:hypothetical protein